MENRENFAGGAQETPKFSSPEEEIAFLRVQVAEKERALESAGERAPRAEIMAEQVREYTEIAPEEVLSSSNQMKVDEIEETVLHFSTEHEKAVDELVDVVEEKGIKNALEVAEKLSPHIFHRLLVQYLMELGTVNSQSLLQEWNSFMPACFLWRRQMETRGWHDILQLRLHVQTMKEKLYFIALFLVCGNAYLKNNFFLFFLMHGLMKTKKTSTFLMKAG